MPQTLFSILIPTHDHGPTLLRAIRSVQKQHFQDFRLIVVGDGAPDETQSLMSALCAEDARIEYRAHPKGAGHGEAFRAAVLADIYSPYLCYLADDDLWLPHHLDVMMRLLISHDFVHTLHTPVHPDGIIRCHGGRIDDPATRETMVKHKWNIFGPTCVGHTMAAYRRLSHGWRPRPDGMWSDLHMWRQWIDLPGCRFYSYPLPTTLHFPSSLRKHSTLEERCVELDHWSEKLSDPEFPQKLLEMVMADWQSRLTPWVPILLNEQGCNESEQMQYMIRMLESRCASLQDEIEAIRNSSSWKITQPLRVLAGPVASWWKHRA